MEAVNQQGFVRRLITRVLTTIKKTVIYKLIVKPISQMIMYPLRLAYNLIRSFGNGLKKVLGNYATKAHWANLASIVVQESVAAMVGALGNSLVHSYRNRETKVAPIDVTPAAGVAVKTSAFSSDIPSYGSDSWTPRAPMTSVYSR
jgi:hypothetical protein